MKIYVDVINQKLKINTSTKNLVSGSQNFIRFFFNLDSDWDGLRVFAQFQQNGRSYNQFLDEENSTYLPSEITEGTVNLSLYGTGGTVIATVNYLTFTVDKNIIVGNAQSTQISTPIYTQLINRIAALTASPAGIGGDVGTELRDIRIAWDGTVHESASDSVHYQAQSAFNGFLNYINTDGFSSNFGGDFNSVPNNKMIPIELNFASDEAMNQAHSPKRYIRGALLTFGRKPSTDATPHYNLDTQIILSQDGVIYWRIVNSTGNNPITWSDWNEWVDNHVEVEDARTGADNTAYADLGTAIRAQINNLQNTGATYIGMFLNYDNWSTNYKAIHNNVLVPSFDALPNNIFASCNVKLSDGAIANSPPLPAGATFLTGTIISLGRDDKARRANYDTQIFIPQDCEKIYARRYFDNAWSAWAVVGGSYLDAQIASVSQFREGVDDDSVRYHHHLYEVTDDGSFFASIRTVTVNGEEVARWNDLPASNQNFIITNTQYSTNWILQTAVPSGAVDVTFRRLIPRPDYDAEPREWVRVSEMDTGKKILAVGDSICRGYRNGEKGFVGDLGLPYQNQGVSGATLSTARTDVTDIPTQLANYRTAHSDYSPDIIIANGGHNDYDNSAPLGDIPTQPAVSIEALNASTVMGGLQKLFLTMIREYPNAQRFFVTTHKIKKNNVYLVTERNSAGYSEQELHDAIVACCKVYNVRVIDIFNDSMLNSFFDEYRSGTNYIYSADDTYGENQAPIASASNNRTDYIDRDGVHPLPRGYLKGYVPLIREAIRIGTVKGG